MLNLLANTILIITIISATAVIVVGVFAEPKIAAIIGVGVAIIWAAWYKTEFSNREAKKQKRKQVTSFGLYDGEL